MDEIDFEADAQEEKGANLADLQAIAAKMAEAEGAVDKLEAELKEARAEFFKYRDNELPAAMAAARLKTLETDDGQIIKIKEDLKVSVPKKRKPEIITKLSTEEFSASHLITNVITIEIGKGKDNAAAAMMAEAEKLGLEAVRESDVNTGSLKALLNSRRKDGKNDDLAFFGAHLVTQAISS